MGSVTITNDNGNTINVSGGGNNTIYIAISKLVPLLAKNPDAVGGTNKPVLFLGDLYFVPADSAFIAADNDGEVFTFTSAPEWNKDAGIWMNAAGAVKVGQVSHAITSAEAQESLQAI